jgi:hypothetical protein
MSGPVEQGHPDYGAALLMERAKGSNSSSSVLAEALRHPGTKRNRGFVSDRAISQGLDVATG